jgi:hypothetical protein
MGMRRSGRGAIAVAVAVAMAIAGCSSDSDGDSSADTTAPASSAAPTTEAPSTEAPSTTGAPATTAAVTTTSQAATTTTASTGGGWTKVVPGGDCQCADASEFSFWVRQADPTKVVFFFQGGGACFSADTCSFTDGAYKVRTDDGDDPTGKTGVFDFTDARNPLADYSFVFVPYCTGDVHIGNATTAYTPDLTVQHKGYVNGNAALDSLVETFPTATQIIVTGESAGSVPTPLYAGLVHDRLPDASITVLADGSGAYPDVPAINTVIGTNWGTANAIPDWPENAGLTAETWSFPGLFVQAGKHDPDIVFARHDYAYDRIQSFFASLAGIPADDLLQLIDKNEAQVEASGIDLLSYISPGDDHTALGRPTFYTETVNGVALVDWVTSLVQGTPVTDEHCEECRVAASG